MKQKKQILEELEELSTSLAKLKGEDAGFRVPQNYFSELPDQVMNRIKKEAEEKPSMSTSLSEWINQLSQQLQWLLRPQYAMALASVAVLLIAGIWWMSKANEGSISELDPLASLSQDEIVDYIDENIEHFKLEILAETEMAASDVNIVPGIPFEDEAVEEYLDEIIDELDDKDLEELL